MIKRLFGWKANHRYPLMRQPDRLPRCHEMSDDEKLEKIRQWNNRNVWNESGLADQDQASTYYGA